MNKQSYVPESEMGLKKEPAEGLVAYYPAKIRKVGLAFMIASPILMILGFIALGLTLVNPQDSAMIAYAGLFLLAGMGVSFLALPVSIVTANIKKYAPAELFDKRSGLEEASIVPEEIKKWSWGAAGLNMIWGIYHRAWWSFISMVPYVNLVWWIVMGIKGNEWAWQANRWQSVAEFKEKQRVWNIWGVISFVFSALVLLAFGIFFFYLFEISKDFPESF